MRLKAVSKLSLHLLFFDIKVLLKKYVGQINQIFSPNPSLEKKLLCFHDPTVDLVKLQQYLLQEMGNK